MKKFDWISFAIVISLIIIGLMMIYAAGYQPDADVPFFSTQAGRQSIFIVAALVILTGSQLIDWKFWSGFAYPFYAFTIFLLLLVLILGSTIKGSTSWFSIGLVLVSAFRTGQGGHHPGPCLIPESSSYAGFRQQGFNDCSGNHPPSGNACLAAG
jgi:cell division protein FtsW (lipid II flippase)